MLSVKPMYQIKPNVAMIDVGIEMAAMIVERRLPRNRSTTSAARNGADDKVFLDARDRCFDELGLIAHDAKPVARRQRVFELRQTLP